MNETILSAAAKLEANGHTLLGGAGFDMERMIAIYRVRIGAEVRVLTSMEVAELIDEAIV